MVNPSESGTNISHLDRFVDRVIAGAEKGNAAVENTAHRIAEIRAVRTAARVAIVPSLIFLIGGVFRVFPATQEALTVDAFIALGSALEFVAEAEKAK